MSIGLAILLSVIVISVVIGFIGQNYLNYLATVKQKQPPLPKIEVSLNVPENLRLVVKKEEDLEYLAAYDKKIEEYEKNLRKELESKDKETLKEFADLNNSINDIVEKEYGIGD